MNIKTTFRKIVFFTLSFILIISFLFPIFSTSAFSAGCGDLCSSWADCPPECPLCVPEPGLRGRKVCHSEETRPPTGVSGGTEFKLDLNSLLGAFPISDEGGVINFANLSIEGIISALIPFIYVLAGIALLMMLIVGGFQLMMSAGDPKGIESGRNKVMFALIGFLIIFASWWLVQILQVVFGLPKIF